MNGFIMADKIKEGEEESNGQGVSSSENKDEESTETPEYTEKELVEILWQIIHDGKDKDLKTFFVKCEGIEIPLNRQNDDYDEDGGHVLVYCVKRGCEKGSKKNFLTCAKILIEKGVEVDLQDKALRTALHWAVSKKSVSFVTELMNAHADPTIEDQDGNSSLLLAIQLGSKDIFNILTGNGDNEIFSLKNGKGKPLLVEAVQTGQVEICRHLLENGADVNATDRKYKRSALQYAILSKRLDIFDLILQYRPDLDQTDYRGRTALHRICAIKDPRFFQRIRKLYGSFPGHMMEQEADDGVTPIISACQNGNAEQLKDLLEQGASVTTKDDSGRTALHYCADNLETQCAEMLLQKDSSLLEIKDAQGFTPLHMSVISGNAPLLKILLKKGADIRSLDHELHTPTHWATVCGHLEVLNILIENGAELSSADSHNAYPIHYAAQMNGKDNGHSDPKVGEKVLKTLLDSGVPHDVTDKDGRPPLLWAASAGNSESIKLLAKAGADVNAIDKDGLSAMHCAASRGHTKCIDELKKLGSDVNLADKNNCTPIFYAITLGNKECSKALLKYGANPNHKDVRGRTPGHCASIKGCLDTVKALDKHKAELWSSSVRGDCPIHEASQGGHCDVVKYLLKWKNTTEAVNVPNNSGRTCLHIAAIVNNLQLCKILLDNGADKNSVMTHKDKSYTPYDAAVLKDNQETADYLKAKGGITGGDIENTNQKKNKRGESKSAKSRKSVNTLTSHAEEDENDTTSEKQPDVVVAPIEEEKKPEKSKQKTKKELEQEKKEQEAAKKKEEAAKKEEEAAKKKEEEAAKKKEEAAKKEEQTAKKKEEELKEEEKKKNEKEEKEKKVVKEEKKETETKGEKEKKKEKGQEKEAKKKEDSTKEQKGEEKDSVNVEDKSKVGVAVVAAAVDEKKEKEKSEKQKEAVKDGKKAGKEEEGEQEAVDEKKSKRKKKGYEKDEDAEKARQEAEKAKREAVLAHQEAEKAKADVELARLEREKAEREKNKAGQEKDSANEEKEKAKSKAEKEKIDSSKEKKKKGKSAKDKTKNSNQSKEEEKESKLFKGKKGGKEKAALAAGVVAKTIQEEDEDDEENKQDKKDRGKKQETDQEDETEDETTKEDPQEAEKARLKAEEARLQAAKDKEEAEKAKKEAERLRREAEEAEKKKQEDLEEAERARQEAEKTKKDSKRAKKDREDAEKEVEEESREEEKSRQKSSKSRKGKESDNTDNTDSKSIKEAALAAAVIATTEQEKNKKEKDTQGTDKKQPKKGKDKRKKKESEEQEQEKDTKESDQGKEQRKEIAKSTSKSDHLAEDVNQDTNKSETNEIGDKTPVAVRPSSLQSDKQTKKAKEQEHEIKKEKDNLAKSAPKTPERNKEKEKVAKTVPKTPDKKKKAEKDNAQTKESEENDRRDIDVVPVTPAKSETSKTKKKEDTKSKSKGEKQNKASTDTEKAIKEDKEATEKEELVDKDSKETDEPDTGKQAKTKDEQIKSGKQRSKSRENEKKREQKREKSEKQTKKQNTNTEESSIPVVTPKSDTKTADKRDELDSGKKQSRGSSKPVSRETRTGWEEIELKTPNGSERKQSSFHQQPIGTPSLSPIEHRSDISRSSSPFKPIRPIGKDASSQTPRNASVQTLQTSDDEYEFPDNCHDSETAAIELARKRAKSRETVLPDTSRDGLSPERHSREKQRRSSKVKDDGRIQQGLKTKSKEQRAKTPVLINGDSDRHDERSPSPEDQDTPLDFDFYNQRKRRERAELLAREKERDRARELFMKNQINILRRENNRRLKPIKNRGIDITVSDMENENSVDLPVRKKNVPKRVSSIQESVRRYQDQRRFVRQLHQLKRAQIYTGPMHDIVLFSKLMDVYKNSSPGNSELDLETTVADNWDGYLRDSEANTSTIQEDDQLRFVSHFYEDERPEYRSLSNVAREQTSRLRNDANETKRNADNRTELTSSRLRQREEMEMKEKEDIDGRITSMVRETQDMFENINDRAESTLKDARDTNSSLDNFYKRERAEVIHSAKSKSRGRSILKQEEEMDERQAMYDEHEKARKEKHKEWLSKKKEEDERLRRKLMRVYGNGSQNGMTNGHSKKGLDPLKASTPRTMSQNSPRPKSMMSSISGSRAHYSGTDQDISVNMTEFGMRRVKMPDGSYYGPEDGAVTKLLFRRQGALSANWTPKYDGDVRPRAGLVFVEPRIYDEVLKEEANIKKQSSMQSRSRLTNLNNLTIEDDSNILEPIES